MQSQLDKQYAVRIVFNERDEKKRGEEKRCFIMGFFNRLDGFDWLFGFILVLYVGLLFAWCLTHGKPEKEQYTCIKTEKNGEAEMVGRKNDDDSYAVMPVIMPILIR